MPTNDGANALHGGLAGFDRKAWTITAIGDSPAPFVTMSYVSADGEEGYPGQLKTDITYRISGGTELAMEMTAVTDKPTVINLTNHSFFNLAGVETDGGVLDHRMTIAADDYLPVSPGGIPLGAPQRSRERRSIFVRRTPSAPDCTMWTSNFGSGRATITITACAAAPSPNRALPRAWKIRAQAGCSNSGPISPAFNSMAAISSTAP